jgi:hypothetical protein
VLFPASRSPSLFRPTRGNVVAHQPLHEKHIADAVQHDRLVCAGGKETRRGWLWCGTTLVLSPPDDVCARRPQRRVTSRAYSWTSRGICRDGLLGQHRILRAQTSRQPSIDEFNIEPTGGQRSHRPDPNHASLSEKTFSSQAFTLSAREQVFF